MSGGTHLGSVIPPTRDGGSTHRGPRVETRSFRAGRKPFRLSVEGRTFNPVGREPSPALSGSTSTEPRQAMAWHRVET
jgi:hypothetical protein